MLFVNKSQIINLENNKKKYKKQISKLDGKNIFDDMINDLKNNDDIEIAKKKLMIKLKPYINEMLYAMIEYSKTKENLIKFVAGFYFIPIKYKTYIHCPSLALNDNTVIQTGLVDTY
jgi:hypothetical protein